MGETLEYLELGSSCPGLFMNDLASREMREWPQLPKTLLAGLLRLVRMVLCKLARRVGWSSHRTRGPTGQTLTADRGCSWAWWLSTTSIAAWVEFVACNRGDRQLKRRRFYHDQGTFRHFSWLAVFLNWETSVSQALFVQHGEWCEPQFRLVLIHWERGRMAASGFAPWQQVSFAVPVKRGCNI